MAAILYDALIIGGGPAGLSAALTFGRQNMRAIVFDSGRYRNAPADFMHMVPGVDHVAPAEFRATARAQITGHYHSITIAEGVELTKAKKLDNGFEVANESGTVWQGKKLILATGIQDVPLDIPGYADLWGTGIYHCLFCKGYEQRGESSAILAVGSLAHVGHALHVARMASSLSDIVTIYTNGNSQLASEIEAKFGATKVMKTDARKITQFSRGPKNKEVTVHFDDGATETHVFISHQPVVNHSSSLADQLGLERTASGEISVTPPFQQTNVRGVFAAGDASSMMKTAPNAIYTANFAGAGAIMQVQADLHGQEPLMPI